MRPSSIVKMDPRPTSLCCLEAPAHQLDQPLGDHQPEAGASDARLLGPESVKRDEQLPQLLLGEPGPGIGHVDPQCAVVGDLGANADLAPRPVVLDRVREQVENRLAQPLRIGHHVSVTAGLQVGRDTEVVLGGVGPGERERVA